MAMVNARVMVRVRAVARIRARAGCPDGAPNSFVTPGYVVKVQEVNIH